MPLINPPCVVTIAGTDPSGGAGIQADIKAISATGSYAASIITALVAQNTQGVQAIQEVPASFVMQQMESVFNDLQVLAVKIGMLSNQEVIEAVVHGLKKFKPRTVVIDPVMVAKNGSPLLDLSTVDVIKTKLLPLATLITPNIFEAEKLLGCAITTTKEMEEAAQQLGNQFNIHVLLKGGHLKGAHSSDVLYSPESEDFHWYHADRIVTKNTHGTGCSLSSAIASYIAQGASLRSAIDRAKLYLTRAIQSGSTLTIGHGHGPVNHFYFLETLKNVI